MFGRILLVIPSYNDSERLRAFLPRLCAAVVLNSNPGIRIQVVDDGSKSLEVSKTRSLVDDCRKEFTTLEPLLHLENNRGKGAAVYAGWAQADSEEWLAFVDADGAIPPEEVIRFCKFASEQTEFEGVLASRVLMLGHSIHRTLRRHIVGRIYATLSSIIVGMPVYDSQCGFKILKRSCFEQVREELRTTRFGFDMELISFFILRGFRLLEIPIRNWQDVPGAKVRLVRDSVDMFFSLLQLRRRIGDKVGGKFDAGCTTRFPRAGV